MRGLIVGLLFLLALPAAAAEPSALPADAQRAIRGVIEAQLGAFRRDDGAQAFSYAAPDIQAMFGTPENFMSMVRGAYMPVYRPRNVTFGELVDMEGQPTQLVHLIGPDGAAVTALYFMQQQPDGSWRIGGCMLVQPPETSA